jgi:hypothetical protein
MKKLLLFLIFFIFISPIQAKHLHLEKEYQNQWCSDKKGQAEYRLQDGKRVDCITSNYAIEFDFANKIYEAVGQALYYGLMTNKTPGIVLIIEDYDRDIKNFNRLELIGMHYGIKVWRMKPEDLR